MLDLYINIKKRREELFLTQTQLAELVGYADKTMISKIEKGLIDLPQSKIILMANALQTTPRALMGWDDSGAPDAKSDDACEESRLDSAREIVSLYLKLDESDRREATRYIRFMLTAEKYSDK